MRIRDYLNMKYGNLPDSQPQVCAPREAEILNLAYPLTVNVSRDFDRELSDAEVGQLLLFNKRRAADPDCAEGYRLLAGLAGL